MNKPYETLQWDSNFFGYRVARIVTTFLDNNSLNKLLLELQKEKIKLVYWFVDPQNAIANTAAKDNKGILVDEKVTFAISIPTDIKVDSSFIDSYANRDVNDRLVSLAIQAGAYSRYIFDPHFTREQHEAMFQIWIDRSVKKEIAEDVLVYKEEGIIVGFITVGIKNNRADIGLLAVDEKYRGKSIGKKLVYAAFKKALELGYEEIQVVAQKRNTGACEFYKKLGFTEESIENVYHFWL